MTRQNSIFSDNSEKTDLDELSFWVEILKDYFSLSKQALLQVNNLKQIYTKKNCKKTYLQQYFYSTRQTQSEYQQVAENKPK